MFFQRNAKCKIARPNTPPLLNVCVCCGCMCATIILWNPTNTRKKGFAEIYFLKINKSNSTFIKYIVFFFQKLKTIFFRVLFLEIQNGKSFLFYCASCLWFSAFVLPQPAARVIFTVCRSWLLCLTKVSVYVCVGECLCLNERKWEEIYYFHPLVLRLSFLSFAFLSVGTEKKRGSPSLQKWLFGSVWVGGKLCVLVSSVVMLPLVSFLFWLLGITISDSCLSVQS